MKAREITKKLSAYCKRRCVLGDIVECHMEDCPLWQLFDQTIAQSKERKERRRAMSDSQLSNLSISHRRNGITDEVHKLKDEEEKA